MLGDQKEMTVPGEEGSRQGLSSGLWLCQMAEGPDACPVLFPTLCDILPRNSCVLSPLFLTWFCGTWRMGSVRKVRTWKGYQRQGNLFSLMQRTGYDLVQVLV